MNRKQLEESNQYKLHHTGSRRGYVSRKVDTDKLIGTEYDGMFGDGFVVYTPRFDTSQYCGVEYWIKVK